MPDTAKVTLRQQADYRFTIDFGSGIPPLYADEPPPLGKAGGPSPIQLLAAAVGNCLADSLLFALRKFRQNPDPIRAEVEAVVGRDTQNRLRVQRILTRLTLGVPAAGIEHLDRALAQFEAFCTVTQSVRQAIPVDVEVFDSAGARLNCAAHPA